MIHNPRPLRALVLAGAFALAVAACGGASSSAAPAATGGTTASTAPAASTGAAASTDAGGSTASQAAAGGDPITALADLNSYKIKLTMSSKGTTGGLTSMGDISMEGTVIAKPEKASDITMKLGSATPASPGDSAAGMGQIAMRIVEVNGKTYTDFGTGTLTESTDTSQSSIADSLSPEKMLGSVSTYLSDMSTVGDEQKNGVNTTHYTANEKTLAAASAGLAMLGLKDAKWNWDVWVAKEGGYAVSYAMKGSGSDGSELTITMDITDVNSPSNVVKGP